MRRDSGVVLINALVIVLTISVVAAALLTRSEAARLRSEHVRGAHQVELYLDAAERLVPGLLKEVTDGAVAHRGQAWAQAGRRFPIDRGQVAVRIDDLQGRLNVNWLTRDSEYVQGVFARLFAELKLPQALLSEITDFLGPSGPRGVADYLARTPPVLPRGGSVAMLDDLRQVRGMTAAHFAVLEPVLSALPVDARLNLNTAPRPVLVAVLEVLPAELRAELLERKAPLAGMADVRARAMALLETEEIEHLQLERLGVSSTHFRAELAAELEGAVQKRRVVYRIEPGTDVPIRVLYRWAVYD